MLVGILALFPFLSGCSPSDSQSENVVVVYSSVDEEFARPLAEQFEKETGIEVKLISDTEKAKSSGLLNRLLEERERPQCDVFLSEDPVRAAVLKKKGLSAPYQSPSAKGLRPEFSDPDHHWTGMSARVRVLLVNMKHPLFKTEPFPTSVYDLANPRYKGQACIGNPAFRHDDPALPGDLPSSRRGQGQSSFLKTCSRTRSISSHRMATWKTGSRKGTSRSA